VQGRTMGRMVGPDLTQRVAYGRAAAGGGVDGGDELLLGDQGRDQLGRWAARRSITRQRPQGAGRHPAAGSERDRRSAQQEPTTRNPGRAARRCGVRGSVGGIVHGEQLSQSG
jgi:hypothetical protein